MADSREKALQDYRKKLLEHKEVDGRLKECKKLFYFDVFSLADNIFFVLTSDRTESPASASWPANQCFVMQLASS